MKCDWCGIETSIIKKVKEDIGTRFEYHNICVNCWNNEITYPEQWCLIEEIRED